MELKRVVITGLGAITPLGNNVEETWKSALEGVSGAGPITLFDASKSKTQFACEVKNFDPLAYFAKKDVRKYDRYAQFAIAAAKEAVADANFDLEKEDVNRIGVIFASGIGGISTFEEEVESYCADENRVPRFNPFFIPKMIGDIAAGLISIEYGFRGPNYGTVSACASSTNALCCAFDTIRLGKANAIVAGGSEAAITVSGVGGFNSMKALSTRNDDPQHASRPFSLSRDGFVMGEGSGCLILEEMEHAKQRGAHIYAEVAGTGCSGDAHHMTAPHPEGLGAVLDMQAALDDADLKAEDIDYINVHGTSTHVGDLAEIKGIKQVFGEATKKINLSSTKSMTGHMLGATGAVEAIFTTLSVVNDIVPPTINHAADDVDPELDPELNYTFNKAQKREVRAALSNTFGFGGHNSSVIIKKFAQ